MTGKHRLDFALRTEETTIPRAGRGWPLRLKDKVFPVETAQLCQCECDLCTDPEWEDDDE